MMRWGLIRLRIVGMPLFIWNCRLASIYIDNIYINLSVNWYSQLCSNDEKKYLFQQQPWD